MTAKAKIGKERKGIQPGAFPIEVPVTDPEETGRYLHVHLDDEEEQKNLYAAIIRAADMKSPEIVAEHIEPYNHAMRSFQYSSSRIASALSEAVRGHEPMHVASLQARDASRATDRFAQRLHRQIRLPGSEASSVQDIPGAGKGANAPRILHAGEYVGSP